MRIAVIGSGPGGAVVTAKLADAGFEVVVFEKGRAYSQSEIEPYSKEEMLRKYNGGGITAAFGSPRVKYVEGACLGGGSEVNAGLYHKIPDALISTWANDYSIEDFSCESIQPHLNSTSNAINVGYYQGALPELSLKLKLGADRLGWANIEVPRWYKYNDNGGIRQSMTETYWPKIIDTMRVKLCVNVKVKTIQRASENRRWHIVSDAGDEGYFDAVFFSAGAIETPRLLRKNKLSSLAGQTLYMHPTIKIAAKFEEDFNDGRANIGVHQVKQFSPDFSFGCSISTPEFIALVLNENGCKTVEVMQHWERIGVYYAMINGGRGKIKNLPFWNEPVVMYYLNSKDVQMIKTAILKLGELLLAAGAIELYPSISGVGKVETLNDLRNIVDFANENQLNLMTIHLMGSCPFGENRKITVADSWGRIHNQQGLYIADSSLMCSGLGLNPQGTVMALASRVASKFLEDIKNV